MRVEYLRSVLRQEVGFFDNEDVSSRTFQIVSNTSTDAHTIQDAIANKVFFFTLFVCFAGTKYRMSLPSFSLADTEFPRAVLLARVWRCSRLLALVASGISLPPSGAQLHRPSFGIRESDDRDRSQE